MCPFECVASMFLFGLDFSGFLHLILTPVGLDVLSLFTNGDCFTDLIVLLFNYVAHTSKKF